MSLKDYLRESFSYFGLFKKMKQVQKITEPEYFSYGDDKEQYCLYYEPKEVKSDKIIVWVHGGGWNAGDPKFFDYVGQSIAAEGYRMVSVGYRLSKQFKYPCQIEDVCNAYTAAMDFLEKKNIDNSRIVVAGPSAGAHLSSIMCYSAKDQETYGVDISNIIGYVGWGGPYSFREDQTRTLSILLNQLFAKGYDRKNAEPVALMSKNNIPMLLIQSRHDGLVEYACAEDFAARAAKLGNKCELYSVVDRKNTHSWYTAGMFMESRCENRDLDKFYSWVEEI